MRTLRLFLLCILAAQLISAVQSSAEQFAAPRVRIVNRIDETNLTTLKGNTHPAANAKNDQGPVSPTLPMTDLILVLSRDQAQQAAFDKFVAGQYDSDSPDFHQWLTPEQVGEDFGPSESDVATVTYWLTGHGFAVTQVSNDRLSIRFNGTAALVQSAFHTEIHNLIVKGVAHVGNMSDPQIPAALASVVVGVKALHNFFPRPLHRMGSQVTLSREAGGWQKGGISRVPSANLSTAARAAKGDLRKPGSQFTINVPANGGTTGNSAYTEEDISPYDFATIYNVLPLWNKGIDGTGQTIAIAGTSDISQNDIATFRTFFGLPTTGSANTPQIVHPNPSLPGGDDPGVCTSESATAVCGIDDLLENSLDVEWSGAVAKNAQIILVTAASQSTTDDTLYDAESYIVNNVTAHVVSVSYGECELYEGTAGNTEYNTLWQNAAAEGIAVFVAAGDSGAASCDDGGDAGGVPYVAEYGLSVSGLASTPYNTAVGGTDFNWCPATDTLSTTPTVCPAAPYWNASNNANQASAVGYVPEMPWNDTCANPFALQAIINLAVVEGVSGVNNTEEACNFLAGEFDANAYPADLVDTVGGGGGVSACTSSDGSTVPSCTGGYAKPSWQAGVSGIPNDGKRDLPDVSFFSSDGLLTDSAYLICVEESGGEPCTYSTDAEPFASEVGGTSASTPPMAGVMALINQKTGSAQGFANPELYKLAATQTYSSCSAESVTASSTICLFNDIDGGKFASPYTNAMPCDYGYNVSGVDSPNCKANDSIQGEGDTIGILSGYSSTAGYDLATGLGSLNVANLVNAWPTVVGSAAAKVTVTPAQSSLNSNQTLAVTGTVTGGNTTTGVGTAPDSGSGTTGGVNIAPTGTVTLTAGAYTASATLSTTGGYSFTIPANQLGSGTDTLTVNYGGDANYALAKGTASVTVSVTVLLTATVTVSPASTTVDSSATLSVPVTVSGAGSGVPPTGTVTLSGGGYTSTAESLSSGTYTFVIPANSLSGTASGDSVTLTVTYSGDGTYGSTTGAATVTVSASTFSLTGTAIVYTPTTASTSGIAPGASATAAVTVSALNSYTGSVTLTCQLTSSPSGASATDAPTCTGGGPSQAVSLPGTTAPVIFTATTTAASTTTVDDFKRRVAGRHSGWTGAGGGAVLALLVFLGVPARRRSWRAMLGMLVVMAALGSMAACGGGGGSGGGTTTETDPGTSAGKYVFTVQAVGSPSVSSSVSTTFTVVVN